MGNEPQNEEAFVFKTISLILLAAVVGSACQISQAEAQVVDSVASARIDSTLADFVTTGKIVGTSALIYEKGEEVYFNAFGFADREAEIPMSRNTIVQIFSMTKPITGVALMTLYEDGAFQLDDPVSQYAPEFEDLVVASGIDSSGDLVLEEPKRPLTIRDLTRHTSGFANSIEIPGVGPLLREADPMNMENDLAQMAEKLGRVPLWFHPGEQWAYGPSVDVQAFLVERLSGEDFDVYLHEHVLNPLQMTETRYFVPESDRDRLAARYFRNDETGELTRIPDEQAFAFNTEKWPLTPGGSGLTSTIDDYMRFARMLVNEGALEGVQILKPETVRLMATNHLSDRVEVRSWLPSKGQVGFGIDFAVRLRPPASPDENNGVVGEFFWDGAASTLFWVDPVNELAAVLFVQLTPFDRIGLHKKFRDAVYGPYDQAESE
jgi:CubicO group peptidase (beta-lactamase class C family)